MAYNPATRLLYDKINDFVTVSDHASITDIFTGGATIEVEINAGSDGETHGGRIVSKRVNPNGWELYVVNELAGDMWIAFIQLRATTEGYWYTTARGLAINGWHRFAITYDDSSLDNNPIFYLDGAVVAAGWADGVGGQGRGFNCASRCHRWRRGCRARIRRSSPARAPERRAPRSALPDSGLGRRP